MSATKELGVYKLFIFITYNTVEGVQLSIRQWMKLVK